MNARMTATRELLQRLIDCREPLLYGERREMAADALAEVDEWEARLAEVERLLDEQTERTVAARLAWMKADEDSLAVIARAEELEAERDRLAEALAPLVEAVGAFLAQQPQPTDRGDSTFSIDITSHLYALQASLATALAALAAAQESER